MQTPEFKPGLYSHFKKGNYYIALRLVFNALTEKWDVEYFRVGEPETIYTRDLDSWNEDVSNHPENETGQKIRYELQPNERYSVFVRDFNEPFSLKIVSDAFKEIKYGDIVSVISSTAHDIIYGRVVGLDMNKIHIRTLYGVLEEKIDNIKMIMKDFV